MKKVLLTGATGLIGKYSIKPLLELGFDVFAVSSREKPLLEGVTWINANLLDSNDIKKVFERVKPGYFLHFAWDTTPGSYLESDLNYDWVNSSLEMLKQFKVNGGRRAVFAGTCFEYEFQDAPLTEYGKLNPTSTYAKCKNNLNELATQYSDKNNISFGWGRIFYVYGEKEQEKRLIPKVIKFLSEDKEFTTSVGDLIKDYMFAGDVAEAFVTFLDTNVEGCVNICTGEPVSIKDIVSLISVKLGKESLVKFIAEENNNAPQVILGDNTRLSKEVHFKPKYSLDSGLDEIIKNAN